MAFEAAKGVVVKTGADAAAIWRRYIQLTEVEWVFQDCQ